MALIRQITKTARDREIVVEQLKGRIEATPRDLSAVNRALNYKHVHEGAGKDARHIADIVADENLRNASVSTIQRASPNMKALETVQKRKDRAYPPWAHAWGRGL
jgi:hypothetical protein